MLFGIDNELLSPGAAVDFALDRLALDQELPPALVELAERVKGERTRDLVERLAAAEPPMGAEAIKGSGFTWCWLGCLKTGTPTQTRCQWSRKSTRISD